MITPSSSGVPRDESIDQDKDKLVEPKGKFAAHAVKWLKRQIYYSGICAAITAIASMTLLVRGEGPKTKRAGEYIGNCYVIAERLLIASVVALSALSIFMIVGGR